MFFQLPWLRVSAEPPPDPRAAEKPPPKRREKGLVVDPEPEPKPEPLDEPEPEPPDPNEPWPRSGRTKPGSKVAGEAGWEPPWSPTAARMARNEARLAPPTIARVRWWPAARRARAGAVLTAGPAGLTGGRSKFGYQGLAADGGAGAVGRGSPGTAVDDGSMTGPAWAVGGLGGSSGGGWLMVGAPGGMTSASSARLDRCSGKAGKQLGLCAAPSTSWWSWWRRWRRPRRCGRSPRSRTAHRPRWPSRS